MRTSNKVQVYLVEPTVAAGVRMAKSPDATRLIRGTLREVESKLRGEVEIRVATAEEAHKMADVEIEDATGAP